MPEEMKDIKTDPNPHSSSNVEYKQKGQNGAASLSAVLSCIQEGVALVDRHGQIIQINDQLARIYQRDKADLLNKSIHDIYFGYTPQKLDPLVENFKSNRHSTPEKTQANIQESSILVRLQPVYHEDQYEGFIIHLTNAGELIKAKKDAQEADRLKSELLANISHEIRTPMNGILGMVDLALETELTSDQKEYLIGIKSSAGSLLSLINNFLDLSKIEAQKVELESVAFNIKDFVYDNTKSFTIQAFKKKIELLCHIPAQANYTIVGDPGRLSQVLRNLIDNAIKYTEKGEVVVSLREDSTTEKEIILEFSVADSGIGIPLEKRKIIFDAFAQADGSMTRKYGGTGLGLSITVELVHLMGGEINMESNIGGGSIFSFTIPFQLPEGTSQQPVASNPWDFKGLPALVIEDNETSSQILREMLEHFNLNPSEAKSGDGALSLLDQAKDKEAQYPILFIDAYLEDNDNFLLLDYLRQYPELKKSVVLLLNSTLKNEIPILWKRLDISNCLAKPIREDELLKNICSMRGMADELESQTAPAMSSAPGDKYKTERTFEIISSETKTQIPQSEVQPPNIQNQRCYRVLLVDDNIVNRKVAQFILQKAGHEVISAQDGCEALTALENNIVDLILMDVQMPNMNGFQATEAIRKEESTSGHHIPIIALTAHAMRGDKEKCLDSGMDDYIAKPIKPEELFETIDRVFKKLRVKT